MLFFEAMLLGILLVAGALLMMALGRRLGLLMPRQRRVRHRLRCVRPLDPDA